MRASVLLLPLLLAAAPPATPGPADGVELAQLTIRERIIIRVPRLRPPPPPPPGGPPGPPPPAWIERRGQRCVPMEALAGAMVSGPGSIDFVLIGGGRVRARFDAECHGLDFYSGFYVRPPADGRMCAGRDALRTRQGAVCPIHAFRRLVPARAP